MPLKQDIRFVVLRPTLHALNTNYCKSSDKIVLGVKCYIIQSEKH